MMPAALSCSSFVFTLFSPLSGGMRLQLGVLDDLRTCFYIGTVFALYYTITHLPPCTILFAASNASIFSSNDDMVTTAYSPKDLPARYSLLQVHILVHCLRPQVELQHNEAGLLLPTRVIRMLTVSTCGFMM